MNTKEKRYLEGIVYNIEKYSLSSEDIIGMLNSFKVRDYLALEVEIKYAQNKERISNQQAYKQAHS